MKISELFKKYRKNTLDELQIKMRLSKSFLSRLEKGDYDNQNISLVTIVKLAHGFDMKVKDILDELEIIKNDSLPSLDVYLRNKYQITSSADIDTIKNIINKFKN